MSNKIVSVDVKYFIGADSRNPSAQTKDISFTYISLEREWHKQVATEDVLDGEGNPTGETKEVTLRHHEAENSITRGYTHYLKDAVEVSKEQYDAFEVEGEFNQTRKERAFKERFLSDIQARLNTQNG